MSETNVPFLPALLGDIEIDPFDPPLHVPTGNDLAGALIYPHAKYDPERPLKDIIRHTDIY